LAKGGARHMDYKELIEKSAASIAAQD